MRSADLLVQTLENLGVQYLFSLSGNQVMPIYDACIDSNLKIIHVRHESAAVHMADAWGRLTGQPGVVLIAGGPGFANALSATYVAKMAESPVVVLSGHSPLSMLGQGAFQEVDQITMAKPVSKEAWMVTGPEMIGVEMAKAFALARSGRPGPVHLMLPQDLLSLELNGSEVEVGPLEAAGSGEVDAQLMAPLEREIGRAVRPLLLAGPAVLRHERFAGWKAALAHKGIPLVGMESPRGVNDPAQGRLAALLAQADLLVLLGKKLDFTLKLGQAPLAQNTRIVQVDFEQSVLDQTLKNSERLELAALAQGSPLALLEELATKTDLAGDRSWVAAIETELAYQPPEWAELAAKAGEPLHPAEVGRAINAYLAGGENSIFISDGGEFGQWMQAFIKIGQDGAKHRVINGKSGSIGNAVPFGLAARLAFPDARIVACSGDGAFGFIPFEMDTAVRYDLPFTVVIGNDACWGAEYQIQLRNYGPERVRDVDLLDSDYHEVVKVLGGWGQRISDFDALQAGLKAAEASGLPACLNVQIQGTAAPMMT